MPKKSKYRGISESRKPSSNGRIPEDATILKKSILDEQPSFSFLYLCPNHCQLSSLGRRELNELSSFLRKTSTMTWSQIKMSDGIKMKKIPRRSLAYRIPVNVSEDEDIFELRVTIEHRIWGFQNNSTFYVIWFDPSHEVCPENKHVR